MSTVVDDYTPLTAGDTLQPFAPVIQMKDASGKWIPFPLAGITISMKLVNEEDPAQVKECTGPWTIDNAAAGQCHYDYTDADVNTPGIWKMVITFTNGAGKKVHGTTKRLQIVSTP